MKTRRRGRRVLVSLVLALLILGGIFSLSLPAKRYWSAYNDMMKAKELLLNVHSQLEQKGLDADPEYLGRVEGEILEAQQRLARARRVISEDPLLRLVEPLPWLGTQVSAAETLVDMGMEAEAIAWSSTSALRVFQRIRASADGGLSEKVVTLLTAVKPQMTAVEDSLLALRQKRQALPDGGLLDPLANAVAQLDARLEELQGVVDAYSDVEQFVPQFLGYHKPMTYLLLTQDNTEIFPTGGLISVYGLVTLDHGRVESLTFHDVASLWSRWQASTHAYVEPPGPLRRYLLRDWSWNLGTSNWSPNFPTAARQAQFFLAEGGGGTVDGVVAINFITIEELLRFLGPLPMPDYGVTVDAQNATELILEQTHTPRARQEGKHTFVGKLGRRLIDKLMAVEPSRWPDLLRLMRRLGQEKQILFYASDVSLQAQARSLGWAGEVKDVAGDYLMLVDTSVQSSKLNLVLAQRIEADIAIGPDGDVSHRVSMHYENRLPQWEAGKSPYLLSQMFKGAYGGYLRLLAPPGSEVIAVLENGIQMGLEAQAQEANKASFGRFFVVARGQKTQITFVYITPEVVQDRPDGQLYRLYLQKQPGTRAIPVTIRLRLPPGAEVLSVELDGTAAVESGALELTTDLRTDRQLTVRYRLADSADHQRDREG